MAMDASTDNHSTEKIIAIDEINPRLREATQEEANDFQDSTTSVVEKAKDSSFRFLDLPAEVRNRVYGFIFANEEVESYNLGKFELPPITRVSRQVRIESLPVFFSENAFHVTVLSNFYDRYRLRFWLAQKDDSKPRPDQCKSHVKACGVLGVKKQIKNMIQRAGPNAVIRDLTLNVVQRELMGTCDAWLLREWDKAYSERFTMHSVHLQCTQGRLDVAIASGHLYPPTNAAFEKEDVDDSVQDVVDEAKRLAARRGFHGFTLSGIEMIARVYRCLITQA